MIMQFMQNRLIEGRIDTANETAIAYLNAGYALKVTLVYEDALTRQWASQVRDLMVEQVGPESLRCTEWKVSDLRERRAFSEGVTALAQADVIVMSLYEAERLPAAFYLWVNVWLQERAGRPGALVALIAPPDELGPGAKFAGANETRRYLSAVAGQGRLEFLLKECSRPGEPNPVRREDIMQLAKAA
jgi:hypothetical protein